MINLNKKRSSRLAARTRIMYMSISIVTLAIIMVVVAFIANGIATDASQRIARQYSIEAAGNFQAHINPQLTLMSQLARSTTVARWLADDESEELQDRAFEEIIGYAIYMPTSRFMLTAYETLNIYDFLPGTAPGLTREDFISLGVLVPGEEAQWFFNTRDDELFFNLNIQREMAVQDLDPGTLQMWANQRVYYQGNFVGVVAIGFPFRYIFDPTFGSFAIDEMRGYIIDRYGGVRVDSAELIDVFDDGLPTFPIVPEALNNPNLLDEIDRHLLQRIDGIYQLGAYTFEAIRLDRGAYSYASIAPITGTDWSVVVLSYQSGIFDFQYMPLIYVVAAVLMLSLFVGTIMMRRIVIFPLLNLTRSAADVDIKGESKLYGMNRSDEIGDLARTIHQAQEELKDLHIVEEKNKAKSEFLARMSHEIRTPISAVLGISEIGMNMHGIPQKAEDSFSKIYSSGRLLLGIINDILDFSKIEGGQMPINPVEYDTASLINNAANLHYAYASNKNIKFNLHVDENLPAKLIGDTLRIEQIIINVLSNAFKYTDSGSVELTLRHESLDNESIMLIISISDTGLGMDEEQTNELFNDYTRFHEHEKSSVSGTGLGMSIVSNLVQLMSAEISVDSEVNVGTTVTISIPQRLVSADILGKDAAVMLEKFEMYSHKSETVRNFTPTPMPYGNVLVVDDIDSNLFVAEGLLDFYSLNVETCKSGQEALNKIKQGKVYDIVFMDHMMPGISGPKTMEMLREIGYTHPIVILTANALVGQDKEYIESGFDAFLSKPIIIDKLDEILVKFIKDKQPPEVIEAAAKSFKHQSGSQDIEEYRNSVYVLERLRADFVKKHKNTFADIKQALDNGDIESVHMSAHALKNLAGLIQESGLAELALYFHEISAKGEMPEADRLTELESELERVLADIGEPEVLDLGDSDGEYLDKDEAIALLDRFKPLLISQNVDCINLLEPLRRIPESDELYKQIEDFNFSAALEELDKLKKVLDSADMS